MSNFALFRQRIEGLKEEDSPDVIVNMDLVRFVSLEDGWQEIVFGDNTQLDDNNGVLRVWGLTEVSFPGHSPLALIPLVNS